eukprot:11159049-Ditylum_brightwellii.AAC.1
MVTHLPISSGLGQMTVGGKRKKVDKSLYDILDLIKKTNLLSAKDTTALNKKHPYVQGNNTSQLSKCRRKATNSQQEELLHGASTDINGETSAQFVESPQQADTSEEKEDTDQDGYMST